MKVMKALRFTRLALGGAVLGIAVAGLISSFLGAPDRAHYDLIGFLVGGGGAAVLLKAIHIV
jgi:hypothetical protein